MGRVARSTAAVTVVGEEAVVLSPALLVCLVQGEEVPHRTTLA
jgi:hypothetical protein